MLRPTNMHYAYVRAVLTTVFIEPIYMPLGGPHIWKIAARTFYETHLPFWGDLCEFFSNRYQKVNDLKTLLQQEIMDVQILETKKTNNKKYCGMPTKTMLTIRHPFWRQFATKCPKLGHVIQHHEFQCCLPECVKISDTDFCVKPIHQLCLTYGCKLSKSDYNILVSKVKINFTQQIRNIEIPELKKEYVNEFKKIELVPRLWHALTQQPKGTSKVTNYFHKEKPEGCNKIKENWSHNERIQRAEIKLLDLDKNSAEARDQRRYKASLERNRIKHFEKRWRIGPDDADWRTTNTDNNLITRGIRNILSCKATPWARDMAIRLLAGKLNNTDKINIILMKKEAKEKRTQRKYRHLKQDELEAICTNQRDEKHRCPLCAEKYTDELYHYFMKCEFLQPIMEAHIQTTIEYLPVTASWTHQRQYNYDIIERFPSDRERMIIFKDYPPEIRTNDPNVKSQLISALITLQATMYDFIKEKIYQPDIFNVYQRFRDKINVIERVFPGTIPKRYMQKIKGKLTETQRPEMDEANHPILVPLEHKIVRVRMQQVRSTIRLYALKSYQDYCNRCSCRLSAKDKYDYKRRKAKIEHQMKERYNHGTQCKCEQCKTLDLIISTTILVQKGTEKLNPKRMDFDNFLKSSKYTKIFETIIQKDEAAYGNNISQLSDLDCVREL